MAGTRTELQMIKMSEIQSQEVRRTEKPPAGRKGSF